MLRDRRSLFGLGAGIIIGAILLQLTYAVFPKEDGQAEEEPTAEQLQILADGLGYAVYPKSEKRYTEPEVEERIAKALRDEESKRQAAEVWSGETSTGYEVSLVVIEPGMNPQEVAEALVLAGLIEDGGAFVEELRKRRLAGRIQIGSFTFVGKPEMSEIIKTITSS